MTSEQMNKQNIKREIERLKRENKSLVIGIEVIDEMVSKLLKEAEDNSSIIETNEKRIEALEKTL